MYITNDGFRIDDSDPLEVTARLRAVSRSPGKGLFEFMEEVSARARVQTGAQVRCSTPEEFVADLLEAGFISRLQ